MKALHILTTNRDEEICEAAAPWILHIGIVPTRAVFTPKDTPAEELSALLKLVLDVKEDVLVLQPPVLPVDWPDMAPGSAVGELMQDGNISMAAFSVSMEVAHAMRSMLARLSANGDPGLDLNRLFTVVFMAAAGTTANIRPCRTAQLDAAKPTHIPPCSCVNIASNDMLELIRAAKLDIHANIARHMENAVAKLLKKGDCHGQA